MHAGTHKHTIFKENHSAEEGSRSRVSSQLLFKKKSESQTFFPESRPPHFGAGLLGKDAQHRGLCSGPLAVALSSSASQQSPAGYAAERERNG